MIDRKMRCYSGSKIFPAVWFLICWGVCFDALRPCLCFTSFLFGDSLVDAGNNNYLFTLSKADSPPYGIDFASSGGHPTGRFTNGRTVSDLIGEALGAKAFPPPFLAPNALRSALHDGINYASGSAGILVETGSLYLGRISLPEQVDYFSQTRDFMAKTIGEKRALSLLGDAIFSIAVGSNDIINYIEPPIPFVPRSGAEPAIFQDFMVSNLTTQLKRLHRLGARRFVVVGIGPLGCIPFVRAIKLVFMAMCSDYVNEFAQGYNARLRRELDKLNEEMESEAVFVYSNSYDIFMDIIHNYKHYGFEDVKDPCCGGYLPPFLCQLGNSNTNSSSNLCKDRSKYVFWDAYHPTEAVNIIMADRFLNGDRSESSPINIRQLYGYKFST